MGLHRHLRAGEWRRFPRPALSRRRARRAGISTASTPARATSRASASPGSFIPGLIGTLPSAELLKKWNEREEKLWRTNPSRVPPLATMPDGVAGTTTALMGQMKGAARDAAAKVGARTVPGREHGGNCDIKNLSRGSQVFFPVYVKGGGLSMGDIHWSQGDGEITFCGAIEMAGWIDIGVDVIKGGVAKYGITNPIFRPSPVEPALLGLPDLRGGVGRREGRAALPRRAPSPIVAPA